jgi:hypothetical protein
MPRHQTATSPKGGVYDINATLIMDGDDLRVCVAHSTIGTATSTTHIWIHPIIPVSLQVEIQTAGEQRTSQKVKSEKGFFQEGPENKQKSFFGHSVILTSTLRLEHFLITTRDTIIRISDSEFECSTGLFKEAMADSESGSGSGSGSHSTEDRSSTLNDFEGIDETEKKMMEIGREEQKVVRWMKFAVFVTLVAAATGLGLVTYLLTEGEEDDNFKDEVSAVLIVLPC